MSGLAPSVTPSMLSEKAILALFDIRDNILAAQLFTAGLSFDKFRDSQLHFYAVTRALEIISEASRRLSDALKARHPGIPWPKVAAIGNILRREYENVAHDVLWHVVRDNLPELEAICREEFANEQAGGQGSLPPSQKS